MRIAVVSYSDSRGGAAVVTGRLADALRAAGQDVGMFVFSKESGSEYVAEINGKVRRMGAKIAERAGIFARNGFSRKNLFKVSTATVGSGLLSIPFVREADAVILGWINQGAVSLEEIRRLGRLGKKIVCIMHDMWYFTGICHHSLGCGKYKEKCGKCPFLGYFAYTDDLSRQIWRKKDKLYSETPLTFVAVSNWLAERASESSLLRNKRVVVIPNPFPADRFRTAGNREKLNSLGIDPERKLVLMGAARLDDPIKDLPTAIAALNRIADANPDLSEEWQAVFFGDISNPDLFSGLRFPHIRTGAIKDSEELVNLYACADIVISSSRFETLPGTLIEGQAAGAMPVTFGNGGQRDIIEHLRTGYIAGEHTPEALAAGIEWAMKAEYDRNMLHESVREKFDSEVVARRIVALLENRDCV